MRPVASAAHIFWLLNIALTAAIGLGLLQSKENPHRENEKLPTISIKEAVGLLNNPSVVFIDARPEAAYQEELIPTALSLPMGNQPDSFLIPKLREAEKVIVYCDGPSCKAAKRVGEALSALELSNIYILTEGIKGWKKSGMPVSRAM